MNIFKYLTNKKYRFFSEKVVSVQRALWDLEFKVAKSRQVREGVRQDRDRAIEVQQHLTARIAQEKDEKIKKEYETQLADMVEKQKRYEQQMKMTDDQIAGSNGDETHEPVIGIIEQLNSYAELRNMYKDYRDAI